MKRSKRKTLQILASIPILGWCRMSLFENFRFSYVSTHHDPKIFVHPYIKIRFPLQTAQVEVFNNAVKKTYSPDAITTLGRKVNILSQRWAFSSRYENEKLAYNSLKDIDSDHIIKDISFNDRKLSIQMPYLGKDLLIRQNESQFVIDQLDWVTAQVVSMYHDFRRAQIFKNNTLLHNLVVDPSSGKLVAIGFGRSTKRDTPLRLAGDMLRVHKCFGAISEQVLKEVCKTYSDFDPEMVEEFRRKIVAKGPFVQVPGRVKIHQNEKAFEEYLAKFYEIYTS